MQRKKKKVSTRNYIHYLCARRRWKIEYIAGEKKSHENCNNIGYRDEILEFLSHSIHGTTPSLKLLMHESIGRASQEYIFSDRQCIVVSRGYQEQCMDTNRHDIDSAQFIWYASAIPHCRNHKRGET